MDELKKELKKIQDEIALGISKLQNESKKKAESDAATIQKLETDLKANVDKLTAIGTKLDSEEKARKDLEILIAKKGQYFREDPKKIIGDPEIKSLFRNIIVTGKEAGMFDKQIVEKTVLELGRHFLPHLSEDVMAEQAKAMLVGSNPDGGYLCPVEMSARIVQRIFETSPITTLANVITTTRQSVVVPLDDGDIDYGWAGELNTRNETTTPQIGEIEIPTHEMFAFPKLTLQVLEDASRDLEGYLSEKAGGKFARALNTACVNGNGVKKPRGFLDYAGWTTAGTYERGKLETIETAGAKIAPEDLLNLTALLVSEYENGATLAMNKHIFTDICKLREGTDGAFLINPRILFEGTAARVLGAPVAFMADMPKTQISGAKAIAYGNFKEGYTVVNRLGIMMIRDVVTKIGWLKLYFRMRAGGAVTNYDAIKILKVR